MKTANASKKYFPVFYDRIKNGNSTATILFLNGQYQPQFFQAAFFLKQ